MPDRAVRAAATSCRQGRTHLWIDAGPGTLSRVQRHVALTELSAVVISHEHPDHSGELPVLRNALRFLLGVSGLPVLTTASARALVDELTSGAEPTFAWDVVADGDERQVGDLRLRFVRTDHPVETLAVRIDHPSGSLAYSADTGGALDGGRLDPDGTGVDLLLVEASMAAEDEDAVQHLSVGPGRAPRDGRRRSEGARHPRRAGHGPRGPPGGGGRRPGRRRQHRRGPRGRRPPDPRVASRSASAEPLIA